MLTRTIYVNSETLPVTCYQMQTQFCEEEALNENKSPKTPNYQVFSQHCVYLSVTNHLFVT
jgi:hypothetical protein